MSFVISGRSFISCERESEEIARELQRDRSPGCLLCWMLVLGSLPVILVYICLLRQNVFSNPIQASFAIDRFLLCIAENGSVVSCAGVGY